MAESKSNQEALNRLNVVYVSLGKVNVCVGEIAVSRVGNRNKEIVLNTRRSGFNIHSL